MFQEDRTTKYFLKFVIIYVRKSTRRGNSQIGHANITHKVIITKRPAFKSCNNIFIIDHLFSYCKTYESFTHEIQANFTTFQQ